MQKAAETEYEVLSDEDIIGRFQAGNKEIFSELVARYMHLVRIKACSFREIFSLEREDLYQEGLLGLYDAACSYSAGDGRASFETYAGKCINNRIVSAVRRSASRKNAPLNYAVSIDEVSEPDEQPGSDPQRLLESREELDGMLETVYTSLSSLERSALSLYLGGHKRSEIHTELGISVKTFDNAMARVRRKLRQK